MSSDGPTIRLTRPLGAVRAGGQAAPPPPSAEQVQAAELRRQLAAAKEHCSRREAELARLEAQLADRSKALDEKLAQLAHLILSVEQERVALLQTNEEEIVSFTLSITEKVLQYEIEDGRYKIGDVVRATLSAVRDRGTVLVRVNPRDLEMTVDIWDSSVSTAGRYDSSATSPPSMWRVCGGTWALGLRSERREG